MPLVIWQIAPVIWQISTNAHENPQKMTPKQMNVFLMEICQITGGIC